jgi:hypothetical protein
MSPLPHTGHTVGLSWLPSVWRIVRTSSHENGTGVWSGMTESCTEVPAVTMVAVKAGSPALCRPPVRAHNSVYQPPVILPGIGCNYRRNIWQRRLGAPFFLVGCFAATNSTKSPRGHSQPAYDTGRSPRGYWVFPDWAVSGWAQITTALPYPSVG